MKKSHIAIIAACAFGLFFYPGEHFFYRFEQMNENAFSSPSSLPHLKLPIPAVKEDAKPLKVSADGVYVVERNTFTVVYKKNEDKKLYPASTTKIITALTTIRNHKLDDVIKVKVATDEGQVMGLVPDEKMSVENLLYGMLVHSANDAAFAIANADDDFPGFINKMNETARELGMKNSHFTNPAGLDEQDLTTTPHDLALAAKALLDNPTLRRMVSVKEITVLDEDYKITHKLANVNELLGEVEGLGGVKTGYTEAAGENLVSYYKTPFTAHEYIIVVMKSSDRFQDTKNITNWITYNIDYLTP
ncbi:MAG: serine hydrolase [Patescibacteria group bacterium]